VEALVLTFAAGAVGMLVLRGAGSCHSAHAALLEMYKTANQDGDIILKTSGSVMLIAFVILTLVGVTAGMWPALKAAQMQPVEALRLRVATQRGTAQETESISSYPWSRPAKRVRPKATTG